MLLLSLNLQKQLRGLEHGEVSHDGNGRIMISIPRRAGQSIETFATIIESAQVKIVDIIGSLPFEVRSCVSDGCWRAEIVRLGEA